MILFKKQVITKVITVRDTTPYGHAPTYQISLIYQERQKCYGPNKEILFKKTIIWPWGQRSRSHEGHYGTRHTALWSCTHIPNIIDLSGKTKKCYCPDKLRREEAEEAEGEAEEEAEEKIRLKQYVSLRSKGRHNNQQAIHLYKFFFPTVLSLPVSLLFPI